MSNILKLLYCLVASQLIVASCWAQHQQSQVITETKIPLSDGVILAADLYMPTGYRSGDQVPVLLEYIPYRAVESRGFRYPMYSYFLKHGYAVARVDIRGTGNSTGKVIPYEYSEIELADGEEVIDWLSKQPWSSGKVGMFGISWGGFNAIQMAARQPPALKAFVSLMATEALYQEDVHYIDGIMHTDSWMMSNDLYNALPGAPDYRLDEAWLNDRFLAKPSVFTYMRNQRDGPFWRRASGFDKYHDIKIPGFHIGGWYDGYRNSLPRMLANVTAPVKALIGPWDHDFPHNAGHSPQIEWRHEAVRWFDQWLKGIDTGITNEPALTVYVRDWHPPQSDIEHIPGKWRYEQGWPIERATLTNLYATNEHRLASKPATESVHQLPYKASVGIEGGGPVMWWGSVPPDQQPMDDNSLVYDTKPLNSPHEILGMPKALLNVSATATRANWIVRISDVAPDGTVTQVTGGAYNGTHRDSATQPKDLVPNRVFSLSVPMHFTSWVFGEGHKIRLSISNAMWPMFWPTPYTMSTSLIVGGERGAVLELPTIPQNNRVKQLPQPKFKAPATDPRLLGFESIESGNHTGYAEIDRLTIDPKTGEHVGVAVNGTGYRYPWGDDYFEERLEHRTSNSNPAKTSVTGVYAVERDLADRVIRIEQDVTFSSDDTNFYLTFTRRAKLNGKLLHTKTWDEVIERDFQ